MFKSIYLKIASIISAIFLALAAYAGWKRSIRKEVEEDFMLEETNEYIRVTKKANSSGNIDDVNDAREFLQSRNNSKSKR